MVISFLLLLYNTIMLLILNTFGYVDTCFYFFFFFQAEDGIRDYKVTGVQTCALPISQVSAIQGTSSGAMIAPVLVPALKIPAARARSRLGNHSATVLMAPGKLADSPSPSRARAAEKPAVVRAKACPIAATLHATTAMANPRRTPITSSSRPAARNPNAYTMVNQDTTSPYCASDQCSSRCSVGARMEST